MFVKPVDGRLVPDPERGGDLPSGGRDVPATQYWLKRLADGDVAAEVTESEPAKRKGK